MSEALLREKFEDLKLTEDEIKRFSDALKKEEFRKLLAEYANEISNPENRKLYEEEIERLENERGVDVTFIKPEAGFVMKTTQNGDTKCFINICKNENIQKPSSEVTVKKDATNGSDKKGIVWSIPHSCSPSREDLDKNGKKCIVYDVVFHHDSYRMAETNARFKQLIKDSAIETIEKNFNVKIDKNNLKILNIKFKGTPTATVIRKARDGSSNVPSTEPQDEIMSKIKTPYQYPPPPIVETKVPSTTSNVTNGSTVTPVVQTTNVDKYTTPKYSIVHRGQLDIQDCVVDLKLNVNSTRPKELVIEIELPLCKSASNVKLDIFEKSLYLESNEPNYKLDLNLPCPVDENNGSAKFDKTKRKLVVTLPVLQSNLKLNENFRLIETISDEKQTVNGDAEIHKPMNGDVETTQTTEVKKPVNAVKYLLPVKYKLRENSHRINVVLYVQNYNKKSFVISVTNKLIHIKYETISNGGYITYYSAYINFKNDCIDMSNNYEYECKQADEVSSEFDEILIVKLKKSKNLPVQCAYLTVDGKDTDNEIKVDIELCDEEELKEQFNNIIDDEKSSQASSKVDFVVSAISSEKFSINIENNTNELDEDDDPDVVTPLTQTKSTLVSSPVASNEASSNNETENGRVDNDELKILKDLSDLPVETKESSDALERSLSNSSQSDSNDSNSQSSGPKLKSILKKPRSVSEGESHHEIDSLMNSFASCSTASASGDNSLETINEKECRKSVSFNQQITRNLFKPNSAVIEMKKPKSNRNRKRNARRKRTISDPSHSNEKNDVRGNVRERNRSVSESSEDGSNGINVRQHLSSTSEEDLHEHDNHDDEHDDEEPQDHVEYDENGNFYHKDDLDEKEIKAEKVLAVNEKHPKIIELDKTNGKKTETSNDDDTILSWKNDTSVKEKYIEKTKCAFKFTNKIMNELDD